MDGSALIESTRESLHKLASLVVDSRLMIVAGDLSPGFMVVAYERINPGLRLVSLCTCASEAHDLILEHQPSHLIICSDLESGDGSQLAAEIKRQHATKRVMLIQRSPHIGGSREAWTAGCEVIVLRRKTGGGRLYDAYRALFTDGAYCDPDLQRQLLRSDCHPQAERIESLTTREEEVLVEIVYGLTNGQISERLGISEATVKRHVYNLMQKLNVSNRAHLATRALRTGLCSWGLADNGPPRMSLTSK